jgi:SLA1 homology domain 1, SHD1
MGRSAKSMHERAIRGLRQTRSTVVCAVVIVPTVLLAMAGTPPGTGPRTWTDSMGRFTVEAELLDVLRDTVRLRTADGRTIDIPLDRLSERDKDYLNRQAVKPVKGNQHSS